MVKTRKFIILACALAVMPLSAYAFPINSFGGKIIDNLDANGELVLQGMNSSQVVNEINASAHTGNNTVDGADSSNDQSSGAVKEGGAKASVEIKSTINGKEIDPVEIESEGGDIKVKSKIEAGEDKARVQREIEIDSVKNSESYDVDLKDSESAKAQTGISAKLANIETMIGQEIPDKTVDFLRSQLSGLMEMLKKLFQNIFNF